jgi:tetratricopeptide (TPR) repeat protein
VRHPTRLNTYGAVLYRAGQYDKALEWLEKATTQRQRSVLSADRKVYGDSLDLLFSAMANKQLAQPEKAQAKLTQGLQIVDQFEAQQRDETPEQSLQRLWERLEYDVIRREAETLVGTPK